jgi:hypothetical protein
MKPFTAKRSNGRRNQVMADAGLAQDNERAAKLYNLSADAELRGDKIRADQYKIQADALAKKLEGRFLNKLTERTAFWSKAMAVLARRNATG